MQQPVFVVSTPVVTISALVIAAASWLGGVGDVRKERQGATLDAVAARAWSGEASAAFRAGAYAPAADLLRMASRFAEHDAVIHYRLGLALRRSGREKEAVAAFRRALEIDPELDAASRVLNDHDVP
ncbi:tetratricopeptide repeat protein [bacterium]|nr:tetratricopeptide repeat protein [bacterium]